VGVRTPSQSFPGAKIFLDFLCSVLLLTLGNFDHSLYTLGWFKLTMHTRHFPCTDPIYITDMWLHMWLRLSATWDTEIMRNIIYYLQQKVHSLLEMSWCGAVVQIDVMLMIRGKKQLMDKPCQPAVKDWRSWTNEIRQMAFEVQHWPLRAANYSLNPKKIIHII